MQACIRWREGQAIWHRKGRTRRSVTAVTSEPPATPPARQERSRRTQNRILTEGTRLLQEGGPEALTVASVAEAADVSVGSVYRRFGDKERLLGAIQAGLAEDFRAEFRQRVADTGATAATAPAEVIGSLVVGMAETFRTHAPLLRVFMLLGTQRPTVYEAGARVSAEDNRFFRDTLLPVASALRHHPDIEAAIDFAYRLTYAACAHRVVQGEHLESLRPLPWSELIDQVRRAVTAYLLCPTEEPPAAGR